MLKLTKNKFSNRQVFRSICCFVSFIYLHSLSIADQFAVVIPFQATIQSTDSTQVIKLSVGDVIVTEAPPKNDDIYISGRLTSKNLEINNIPVTSLRRVSNATGEHLADLLELQQNKISELREINRQINALASQPPFKAESIPEAINIKRNTELNKAWINIQKAHQLNQERVNNGENPLPDPLFAEALLWQAVNDHDNAMRCYLEAMEMTIDENLNREEYSNYFKSLTTYLRRYYDIPSEDVSTGAKSNRVQAIKHLGNGLRQLYAAKHEQAAISFSNSISLDPTIALSWYGRAIAYKHSNQNGKAQHDALLGVRVEKKWKQHHDVDFGLERIQGRSRHWLERFRLGESSIAIFWEQSDE